MLGVCRNFFFDYVEGDCLPPFCHGRYGLKIHLNGFFKKILTSLFGKKQKWDKNIYDVDKKSESLFETCCPIIFFNECLSTDKF